VRERERYRERKREGESEGERERARESERERAGDLVLGGDEHCPLLHTALRFRLQGSGCRVWTSGSLLQGPGSSRRAWSSGVGVSEHVLGMGDEGLGFSDENLKSVMRVRGW
jgi:hypothetical protein